MRDRATLIAGAIAALSLVVLIVAAVAIRRASAPVPIAPAPQVSPLPGEVTLGSAIESAGLLTGEHFRALLNTALMTAEDGALSDVIPVDPAAMIVGAQAAIRGEGKNVSVMIDVFDGSQGHAVNLLDYDAASQTFGYYDPWGAHRSFLQAGYNAAGVEAVADPAHAGTWRVKADELQRVLYAVLLPFGEMVKLNAVMPLGAFGSLGDTLDAATKTELFSWFHLEQTGASTDAHGHRYINFRPSGGSFHSLADVVVTTDTQGRLQRVILALSRAFIDDPRNAPFARDLALSFLRDGMPARDQRILSQLPSTFLGPQSDLGAMLSRSSLRIENIVDGRQPLLLISFDTLS